jgi:hypothetical protein
VRRSFASRTFFSLYKPRTRAKSFMTKTYVILNTDRSVYLM